MALEDILELSVRRVPIILKHCIVHVKARKKLQQYEPALVPLRKQFRSTRGVPLAAPYLDVLAVEFGPDECKSVVKR